MALVKSSPTHTLCLCVSWLTPVPSDLVSTPLGKACSLHVGISIGFPPLIEEKELAYIYTVLGASKSSLHGTP